MGSFLIVANQTLGGEALARRLEQLAGSHADARFLVVAPVASQAVMPSEIGGVMGGVAVLDVETQQFLERDARERLATLLSWCDAKGVPAEGTTVVGDPVATIERLVRDHEIDEIVVSTLPSRFSRWLRVDLVRRIARRVDIPVSTITAADAEGDSDSEPDRASAPTTEVERPATTQPQSTRPDKRRPPVAESVYKIVELVGTSSESWEKAAAAAVAMASRSLRDLRVAEIAELDLVIDDGAVTAYRAKIKVSFKYDPGAD